MPISLGGVPEPTSKDEPVGPVEGTPKNEEAAKEGMADGGLMGGKVEEPPRKPPERRWRKCHQIIILHNHHSMMTGLKNAMSWKSGSLSPVEDPACRSSTSLISTSETGAASATPEDWRLSLDAVGTKSGTLSPKTASIVKPLPGFISSSGGGVPLLTPRAPPAAPCGGRRGPRPDRGEDDMNGAACVQPQGAKDRKTKSHTTFVSVTLFLSISCDPKSDGLNKSGATRAGFMEKLGASIDKMAIQNKK